MREIVADFWNSGDHAALAGMSKSENDRRARPNPLGSHDRLVRLWLKLAGKTIEETERLIEESRRLLNRPVYPDRDPPRPKLPRKSLPRAHKTTVPVMEAHRPRMLLRYRSARSALKLLKQKVTEAERAIEVPHGLLDRPVHPFVRKHLDPRE